jgi:tetratricopeptide (TPR) repeat protein
MIFTFYSYKGGVGRSMTLANTAAWLRQQGLRVAMVDWDLEAPGLESFFFRDQRKLDEFASQVGVIDTLLGYKRVFPRVQKRLEEQQTLAAKIEVLESTLPPLSASMCRLDDLAPSESAPQALLFTAGLRAGGHFAAYAHNVQTFDWDDFYHSYNGHAYFEWMRRQLLSLADVVLIDSRTGLNEMSGVCAQQLADVVVSFCAANVQNLGGVVSMANAFLREELVKDRSGRRIEVLIVPTRIDNFNAQRLNEFEEDFRARTEVFTPTILKTLKTDLWSLQLPYAPSHASLERIIIGQSDADKKLEEAYKRLSVILAMLAPAQAEFRRCMADEIRRVIGYVLPRVVIVAEEDHSPVAERIRSRIEAANLGVWPIPERTTAADRCAAIAAILEQARVLVVPATEEDLQSDDVRDAWRRARQLGVWVLPIFDTPPAPDVISRLPGWMRAMPVLSLDRDWSTILTELNKLSPAVRVPQMAPQLPADCVPRQHELEQLKSLLLAEGAKPTRIALYGPPGSGKSTLAKAIASDDDVQTFFTGGILWVAAHQTAKPQDELSKIYLALTGEASTFTSAAEIWGALQPRLSAGRFLVILDDLEGVERLREFGWLSSCRYLITTHDRRVAAMAEATPIEVGPVADAQAREILARSGSLAGDEATRLMDLVGTLPQALKVASATAASQVSGGGGVSVTTIADQVDKTLKDVFEKIMARLDPIERERAAVLTFNTDAPSMTLETVAHIWQVDAAEARHTLTRFADLSLVSISEDGHQIELHPYARRLIAMTMPGSNIDKVLDAAFARIPEADRDRARSALCRLVRVNDHADIEPRSIRAVELPADQVRLLASLVSLDIIHVTRDESDEIVTLAHPAACRQWQQLRKWIQSDREFLGWRQRLDAYVADRHRIGDQGSLLVGALLDEAVRWKSTRDQDLSELEREYIRVSNDAATRDRRSLLLSRVAMAIVILIFIAFGYMRWRQPVINPVDPVQTVNVPPQPSIADDLDVLQGDRFASRGDYAAAIRSYTNALGRFANNPDLLYKRGVAYSHTPADADKAMADLDVALRQAPGRPDVLAARGAAWLAQNKPQPALKDLDAAIAADQKNAQAFSSRAAARTATGNPTGALDDYTKAIQLAPAFANAYFNRATLYQQEGNTQAAIADLQQVVKLSADSLDVRAAQARLDQLAGKKPPPNSQIGVFVHYQNGDDEKTAIEIVRALAGRGFRAEKPQRVTPAQATYGDVRFLAQDRGAALAINEVVQDELADRGYRLRLRQIVLQPTAVPTPRPGRVEVWLPPLASAAKY